MLGPLDLVLPPVVLLTAIATLPFTVITLLATNVSALLSATELKHTWFKHFWWWFGPGTKFLFAPNVKPLLHEVYGVVLDIGPASGIWMRELGEAAKASPSRITKIHGIEPNVLFHEQLRASAKKYGLGDVYEPVAAYAQDLEKVGIEKGSVDTIITVHVLCSVGAQAESVIKALYEYLKPGGQWLVYEHIASEHTPVRIWQDLHNVLWTSLLDGCHLTRNTDKTLKNVGEWESASLGPDPQQGYFETLPHTVGKLIKKR